MKEIESLRRAFGNRKMASLLLLGFASGLPLFLTTRTLQLWMKDANVDIGKITLFGLVSLPYSLKFVWSPLVDRFPPPFLGARRGWLLLTQIGLVIAIATMALQTPTQNTQTLMVLGITSFAIAFLSATQDIVGDAYRTDILNPLELETGASLWVLGYRVALFVAFSLAAGLAGFLSWNAVYLLMAVFMAVGIITTLRAPAEPQPQSTNTASLSIKDVIFLLLIGGLITGLVGGVISERIPLNVFYWILGSLLVGWITICLILPQPQLDNQQQNTPQTLQEAIILPLQIFFKRFGLRQSILILVFIVLYKLGDSLVGITANLFAKEIKFTNQELAAVYVIGLIATTVGVLMGGVIMTKIGINRSLWIFGLLQLLSNLGYYAMAIAYNSTQQKDNYLLVIAILIENTSAGLVTVATVAYLMSLCSHNFTTTQFALFSSLMALSRDILSAPAGDWAKATGWSTFFLITIAAAIPGLLLLPIVAPWNSRLAVPRPGLEDRKPS